MLQQNSRLKEYLLDTSFHGYRFIAEEGRHWTERVFWSVCCLLSWIAIFFLIHSAWYDFQNNAISFVVDTSYLDWDTDYPAVVVCETDNTENIARVSDMVYGDPHDYNLDEVVKEMVYFKGVYFYTVQTCGPDVPRNSSCFKRKFSDFSKMVQSSCADIFHICKWNSIKFDCCKYFREMDTEMGLCYALNSKQTREIVNEDFSMISNKDTGPGSLYLEIVGYATIFTFGKQEVPTLTTLLTDFIQVTPYIYYERRFSVKEIENQPEVKYISVEQRKCKFDDDSDLDVYKYYSYSACSVQCRKDAQLKKCGCVHHLVPNTTSDQWCDIEGYYCLNKYSNELAVLKAPWSNRTGLVCGCLPSCTEIELSIIREEKEGISEEYAIVNLFLERLPTERFKRNVVRGKLDLVVSMGGATALFLGASILSFVEVIYFFVAKPLIDLTRSGKAESIFVQHNKR